MKGVFLRMWELAKPYYERGRCYDIDQVKWMLKKAEIISKSFKVNTELLFPLVILHDVGYSAVGQKNPDIKERDSKRIHMKRGAEIAQKILEMLKYAPALTKQIVHYVSVHDNWALGDDSPYKECIEIAIFTDLDFLYVNSSYDAFRLTGESMGLSPKEFYEVWIDDEKLTRRPFCCAYTKRFWETSIERIRKTLEEKPD
ncbi:MAG: HD domain-containing protein [Candidatus Woesearchaeota archaeon]